MLPWLIQRNGKESIYTLKLLRKGVDVKAGKEVNLLKSISVTSVMNTKVETLYEGLTMDNLFPMVSRSKFNSFPIRNLGDSILNSNK